MATDRRRRRKTRKFVYYMQSKLMFVFIVVMLVTAILIGRLTYINRKDGERYEKRVLSQQSYTSSAVPYRRGSIVDRNGTVLASSDLVYNLILDAKLILEKEEDLKDEKYEDGTSKHYLIRDAVSEHFGIARSEIDQVLADKPKSQYIVLRRHLDFNIVNPFEEMMDENKSIVGVWFEEEYIRNYPYGDLAAHVIGFTAAGNVGTGGVEQYYNDVLNGTNGREYGYYDSELNLRRIVKEAVNGNTIRLTIDANIQHIVQKHLKTFIEEIGANNVAVLVMDPNTGDILAMGVNDSYDLNNPRDLTSIYTQEEIDAMDTNTLFKEWNKVWRNFCISQVYEPGSTWKPMTIAAAMEEDLVTTTELFKCDGYEYIGGYRITCNNRSGHGLIDLTHSLMKSCNDALMEIGKREGGDLLYAYQKLFGLGSKTGIDLPGEEKGLLKTSGMGITDIATNSFGQNFNVTMVQMAAAFCSLVNGGYYYEPRVVSEIINDEGATVEEKEPVLVRETVSNTTSEFIKEAMYMTVAEGTAGAAGVEGYLIGGKTGTAQKQPREDKRYLVSFLGCVPVDDPQAVIYVVVDEAQNVETQASSTIATSFASKIMSDILPFLGIYPDGDIEYNRGLVGDGTLPEDKEGEDGEEESGVTTDPLVDEEGNPIVYDPSQDESNPDAIPPDMDGVTGGGAGDNNDGLE